MPLDGFSRKERGQARPGSRPYVNQPAQATETRRPRRDEAQAPAGYDQDCWHLALLFRAGAQRDRIELAAKLPVICLEIDDLVTRYGIRGQTFRHVAEGCQHRETPYYLAIRCWYHYPPMALSGHESGVITWVQMVEIIIAEFWSRIQNEHALDYFRQSFGEYGQAAVRHWANLRVVNEIAARPHVRRGPMRRRQPAGTMQAASKEG